MILKLRRLGLRLDLIRTVAVSRVILPHPLTQRLRSSCRIEVSGVQDYVIEKTSSGTTQFPKRAKLTGRRIAKSGRGGSEGLARVMRSNQKRDTLTLAFRPPSLKHRNMQGLQECLSMMGSSENAHGLHTVGAADASRKYSPCRQLTAA